MKLRYYVGASSRLYFYIFTKDGVVEERVIIQGQRWAEPVISYVKSRGKHRVVPRRGYSNVVHMYLTYRNHVWVAKIPPGRLLRMITLSPTWQRSEHAKRIVQLLREA